MATLEELKARRAELVAQMVGGEAPAPVPVSKLDQLKARRAELAGPKEKESGFEDFGEGLGVSGLEMYYGVKDLFGQMDDEDRATLEDWKEDASESGWGTAGRVTGELAQFMIPGGVALKGLKGVNALKNASKLKKTMALMGTEGATAAAVGATRLPGEGETRGENAATEGLLGAAGAGIAPLVGRALSKTMRGADKLPEAEKLMAEGIELTPGQMAKSPAISGLETVMEVTPFAARTTKALKKSATEQWNKKILQDAMPEGIDITAIGEAGKDQMKEGIKRAYKSAWKDAGPVSRNASQAMHQPLVKAFKRLNNDDGRVLKNLSGDILKALRSGDPKAAQTLDDTIRRQINAAGKKKPELRDALEQARKALRDSLPDHNFEALEAIDAKYPDYLSAKDAINRADLTDGIFTPNQYTKSVSKQGRGDAKGGLKEAARMARATVGKKEGGQPLEWFRRVAGALPSPPGMEAAGRTLMGQTRPQRAAVRGMNNPRVQAMRELTSSGGASAALYDE